MLLSLVLVSGDPAYSQFIGVPQTLDVEIEDLNTESFDSRPKRAAYLRACMFILCEPHLAAQRTGTYLLTDVVESLYLVMSQLVTQRFCVTFSKQWWWLS